MSWRFNNFNLGHFVAIGQVEHFIATIWNKNSVLFANDNAAVASQFVHIRNQASVWFLTTVIPVQFERRLILASASKFVVNNRPARERLFVMSAGFSLNRNRIFEVHRHVHHVKDVAAHISQRTCTEVPPASPHKWVIPLCKRSVRSRTNPKVKIKNLRGNR